MRFVFGIFDGGHGPQPVALGLYPQWLGAAKPSPQTYRSPVGEAAFAHAGPVEGAQLFHKFDEDGRGFVLVAAIPRSAIPLIAPFSGGTRTLVNFEATFGGHNKFWWANADGSANRETYDEPSEARLYPGSWAPAQFLSPDDGVVVRQWLVCGPFGGPGAERFKADPNGNLPGTKIEMKRAVRDFCEAAAYPPDRGEPDLSASYTGDMIRGYWPDPRAVRWQPRAVAELDTRVNLGLGGQVWYAATWVRVPADTELNVEWQSHQQTTLRWSLNGQPVEVGAYREVPGSHARVAEKPVLLRSGWNRIQLRGYCVGYPPFRAGLVLRGAADQLWTLQLSGHPPAAEGGAR